MRLLRLVGPGEDGTFLIVETVGATDQTERFSLPIDERLRTASSSDLPRLPVAESEAAKAPSPREIQTRVRAGESAQQVADQAGITLERVMRFAYPVLAERVRVTDEARRARARRGGDGQLVLFGELIDLRLNRHGVDPAGLSWDAYRREDGGWTVTLAFTAHGRQLLAKFSFALLNRTVSALDDIAADLLSDRPVQALLPPAPTQPAPTQPAPPESEPGPARLTAVPDPAHADPALDTPPPAVRAPGRRQKAHTRPVPVGAEDELFDQNAIDQPWHEPPLALELAGAGGPDAAGPDAADDGAGATATAAAAKPADEPATEPDSDAQHRRGRRGEKPRMPSWDDILLGVRHKSD